MDFHYYLLINQAAGSGNGKKAADTVLALLDQDNYSYTALYSEYPGHEQALAKQLAEETLIPWGTEESALPSTYPLLIVLGGDGTLHQVLNTFYQLEVEFPIGYIPAGSGNDFARGVKLSRKPADALRKILSAAEPQAVNLVTYNEQINEKSGVLVNNLGIGLDASIVHVTNHSPAKERLNKYNLGSFAYIFSVLHVLFTQKGFPVRIEANGQQLSFNKAFLCTATNHPYFGGGVSIAPTADAHQPTIDFVLVERIALVKIFWLILLVIRKKQLSSKYFHHITTSKLRIISTVPQYAQADGEDWEKQSFDLQFSTKKQLFWF